MPSEKKKAEKQQPPFLFRNAQGLLMMTQQHNVSEPRTLLENGTDAIRACS